MDTFYNPDLGGALSALLRGGSKASRPAGDGDSEYEYSDSDGGDGDPEFHPDYQLHPRPGRFVPARVLDRLVHNRLLAVADGTDVEE